MDEPVRLTLEITAVLPNPEPRRRWSPAVEDLTSTLRVGRQIKRHEQRLRQGPFPRAFHACVAYGRNRRHSHCRASVIPLGGLTEDLDGPSRNRVRWNVEVG